jgi:uncharacterized protein (TIGR00297 family)
MTPAAAAFIATSVALTGWRVRWLTASGAMAAALVGTAVLWGGGVAGLVVLGTFFVSGSVLSPRTAVRSRRTWVQVAANGWTAAVGGVLIPIASSAGWAVLAGGLAAAQADTWATELGRHSRTTPVLLTTGRAVPAGTSGGVTLLGTLGGALGAVTIAAVGGGLRLPLHPAWLAVAGTLGMCADSLLGATVQGRARCIACGETVEELRHCARTTHPIRGLRWMTNDAVNAVSSAVGAAVTLLPLLW